MFTIPSEQRGRQGKNTQALRHDGNPRLAIQGLPEHADTQRQSGATRTCRPRSAGKARHDEGARKHQPDIQAPGSLVWQDHASLEKCALRPLR